jgi:hypothetical protein
MDSTDEKIYKIQQARREAEAKEQAKRQQKEIAKRRQDPAFAVDKTQSMSSADFAPKEEFTAGAIQAAASQGTFALSGSAQQ